MELDAFFRAFRERHPDVDLVMLPPEQPGPEPDEATLAAQRFRARAAMTRVEQAYDELAQALPEPDVHVATWGRLDGRPHPQVRATHRGLAEADGPIDLLRIIGDRLDETGWEVRLAGPRLIARRDGLLATADPSPSTVIVALAGQPVSVSDAALRQVG